MEKLIKRIANGAIIVLAAVAVIAGLIVAFKGGESPNGLDASFYVIYILICIAILLIGLFAVMQGISNKKQMLSTLILLAVCAVIVLVSYFLASSSQMSEVAIKVGVSESVYRWAGTALNIAYITFTGVVIAFVGSLVYVKMKNR